MPTAKTVNGGTAAELPVTFRIAAKKLRVVVPEFTVPAKIARQR